MKDPNLGKPKMPGNKRCGTCFYYEPSPLWRKGWCRNPSLFEGRVNHLVEAGEYSCQGTFSTDFWLAAPRRKSRAPVDCTVVQSSQPSSSPKEAVASIVEDNAGGDSIAENGIGTPTVASASKLRRQTQWGVGPSSRHARLSVTVLVAAIALVLISALGWISYSTAGAKESKTISTTASLSPTPDLINPMFGPSPTPTVTASLLAVDRYARVVGTENNGLQVRLDPGSESPSVALLPDGTIVHLLKGPVAVDGYLWWEIEAAGKSGWSADKWLVAVAGPAG
ncbi:MAG: hypothetical protein M1358_01345 [Chloroflexi bacterium]|nr:hypothetical protein [Chloroflexota bacterium]